MVDFTEMSGYNPFPNVADVRHQTNEELAVIWVNFEHSFLAPLMLWPYGALQICLLLLLIS